MLIIQLLDLQLMQLQKLMILAVREEALASADSSLSGLKVNRFLHIAESAEDLVLQNKMQRKLGQNTGTCFQRCVGMDAMNALHSTTFEIDEKHGTDYHKRFLEFVKMVQKENFVIGGAMTDPKGDRSKGPSEQDDPDLFTRIVKTDENGVYVSGAKAHQTGCINSHWIILMPTIRLTEELIKTGQLLEQFLQMQKVSLTFTVDNLVTHEVWKKVILMMVMQSLEDKKL